jgi:hypothetical protein
MQDGYSTEQLIGFINGATAVADLEIYIESIKADDRAKAAYNVKFPENLLVGGKRGKKGTKKRKEPSVLASWRKFVRKVQHEEKITYPEAMKRASKRKSEWQRGGADMEGEGEEVDDEQDGGSPSKHFMKGGSAGAVDDFDGNYGRQYGSATVGGRSRRSRRQRGGADMMEKEMMGGSRRRRGTKKRRGSRRR